MKKILIIGDSHVHCLSVMNIDADIRLCKRQSATAYGVNSPESKSNANKFFINFLENKPTPDMNTPDTVYHAGIEEKAPDFICFMLGEVDCRSLTHKKGLENWQSTLTQSASNLAEFIKTNLKEYPAPKIALLHPPLPKSAEPNMVEIIKDKTEALKMITEFSLFYGYALKQVALKNGFLSFGINEKIFNPKTGLALEELLRNKEDKWHLDRPNKDGENLVETLWARKFQKYFL